MFKKIILLNLLSCMLVIAQWTRVSELEIGSTGKIMVHNESVFIYGKDNGFKLSRSDDNGQTWTDISGNAPDELENIFSYKGKLFANSLTGVGVSEDDGASWNVLSSVTITGTSGTIRRFSSDGDILFAVSNRKSIFRSTDEGSTWQEIVIDDPDDLQILNFEAVGDYYFAIVVGAGLFISKDAGATWANENPSSPLTGVYNYNGVIYGMSGNGVFKFDFGNDTWTAFNSGFPSDGAFYWVTSMTHIGNTIFTSGVSILANFSSVHSSSDNGISWVEPDNTNLPSPNSAGSYFHITANSSNVFYYYYGLADADKRGLYTTTHNAVTSVEKSDGLPENYSLSQNYPNPFNPSTTIQFSIPETEHVSLKIFDSVGREVKSLVNDNLGAGVYSIDFNAGNLSSGVYFYRLKTGRFQETRKLTLIK